MTEGSICIDGVDVRKATQESLHKNIGVVQQEVFLFADSIAENIRYGKLDATMDEIIQAAKMAEIYDATFSYLDCTWMLIHAGCINDRILIMIWRGKYNVREFEKTSR